MNGKYRNMWQKVVSEHSPSKRLKNNPDAKIQGLIAHAVQEKMNSPMEETTKMAVAQVAAQTLSNERGHVFWLLPR
jgi:hypothetical protein